ncbi:DUF4012 domain-containing protein [Williamsia phyllosphaerae]|uniref:DUF4012 domain-containing protein n=1 Tax=Williamsia phyllosphaerae TaxID=885042 RepID=UPI00166CC32B|nr:DUF4012 domain-containing protein [Williamsia phyllosphaerae]
MPSVRSRGLRWLRRLLVAALLITLCFVIWCSIELVRARADLSSARGHLIAAQASISGDSSLLDRELVSAGASARSARQSLDRPPLRGLARLPWIGDPIDSTKSIADVLDQVANTALPPAAEAVRTLTTRPLLDAGRIDVNAIRGSQPALGTAASATADALRQAQQIRARTWLGPVNRARSELVDQLTRLDSTLRSARTATDLAPGMLGADRKRTYLVGLQNNAEARGTGGLVGGLVLFSTDRGRITLDRVVKDLALPPGRGLDLGADYRNLYGTTDPTQIWQNSNQSPHFPYAARIWRSLARQLTGVTADVVIGIDPPGLRSILSATGPITLDDGETATADNIVQLTESAAYARFDTDRSGRKTYLADIAEATFDRITSGRFQIKALAEAFGDATKNGRIAMWSQVPAEQAELAATDLGHEVPYGPGPYANVVVNNSYASKLDYYLSRAITYRRGACADTTQEILVDVTLRSDVPDTRLSPEVLGTFLPGGGTLPPRSNKLTVSLYSSWGSQLTALTVDGVSVGLGRGTELGHPAHYTVVTLPPGKPVTVQFALTVPRSDADLVVPVQPLTNPADVRVLGQPCR